MPSFRQISAHFPALVIDASSTEIQVGLLEGESRGAARWQSSSDEAGVAVFEGVKALGIALERVGVFVYCDGPGSVLGIRTVAMALRTWQILQPRPAFAYCSLAMVAHGLGDPGITVIADARRETWHRYRIGEGLSRVPASDLSGDLVMPEHFRHWSALPEKVRRVPYSVAEWIPKVWDADLLIEAGSPDAFLHEEPSYVTWTPQIHRAPGTR
jgi:tRNA threonylcarbamoyladenosine biosynthesis protein TsaB